MPFDTLYYIQDLLNKATVPGVNAPLHAAAIRVVESLLGQIPADAVAEFFDAVGNR